jgi:F-box and WD-40 domain protein 1/11
VPFHIPQPTPGHGDEPPVVPENAFGGSAARAAAAAQNEERLSVGKVVVLPGDGSGDRDAESGIGIEVRQNGEEGVEDAMEEIDMSLVRTDPVPLLPIEIFAHVLGYLDHKSLLQTELVSKHWKDAATSHHVWREVFRNEHSGHISKTSPSKKATIGRGMGKRAPDQDWKTMFSVRKELRRRWKEGNVTANYLAGHTDSVYCVQFDE